MEANKNILISIDVKTPRSNWRLHAQECLSPDGLKLNLVAVSSVSSDSVSVFIQITELFARSSVSCLTGGELQSVTAERGDPCWQVTQQLHLLIEKVTFPQISATMDLA